MNILLIVFIALIVFLVALPVIFSINILIRNFRADKQIRKTMLENHRHMMKMRSRLLEQTLRVEQTLREKNQEKHNANITYKGGSNTMTQNEFQQALRKEIKKNDI